MASSTSRSEPREGRLGWFLGLVVGAFLGLVGGSLLTLEGCDRRSFEPPIAEGESYPVPGTIAGEGRTIRSWIAGCGTGEDLWKWRDSTTVKCDAEGVELVGSEGAFEWPVDLLASEIDGLVAAGRGLGQLDLELSWSSPGEPFDSSRTVEPSLEEQDSVVFDLTGVDGWSGVLRRFRLSWAEEATSGEKESRILEVRVTVGESEVGTGQ